MLPHCEHLVAPEIGELGGMGAMSQGAWGEEWDMLIANARHLEKLQNQFLEAITKNTTITRTRITTTSITDNPEQVAGNSLVQEVWFRSGSGLAQVWLRSGSGLVQVWT